MRDFPVICWKKRLATRLGLRSSELTGAPTALIDDERLCRLGQISAVVRLLAIKCRLDDKPPGLTAALIGLAAGVKATGILGRDSAVEQLVEIGR
jgi:hypothetical protein